LLGRAAILEGRYAQSIPTFGPERRGALSSCTLRISDQPILLKCAATTANILCLLDPTIWHFVNITAGFLEEGILIFNTTRSPGEVNGALTSGRYGYKLDTRRYSIFTVDATGIALKILKRAITNTAMMGAFARATGLIQIDSVKTVLEEKFEDRADVNIRMALTAFEDLHCHRFGDPEG